MCLTLVGNLSWPQAKCYFSGKVNLNIFLTPCKINWKKICYFGWYLYSILYIILHMEIIYSATVLQTEIDIVWAGMTDSAKRHAKIIANGWDCWHFHFFPVLLNAYLFHKFICFGFVCLLVSMVCFNMINGVFPLRQTSRQNFRMLIAPTWEVSASAL